MKQTVYFIRHGNTHGIDSNLMYGATDIPVTEAGLAEVRAFAAEGRYPSLQDAVVYTSGMLRTEQTLEAIYGRIAHRKSEELKEINFGKFEMMKIDEILEDEYGRAWLNGELKDPHFEGGDSFSGFSARVRKGLRTILDDCARELRDKIILVIHGEVISFIMDDLFPEVSPENVWDWTPSPGCGYIVEFSCKEAVSFKPIGSLPPGIDPRK